MGKQKVMDEFVLFVAVPFIINLLVILLAIPLVIYFTGQALETKNPDFTFFRCVVISLVASVFASI